jgi:universal stress protein E
MQAFRKIVVGIDLDAEGRATPGSRLALSQALWTRRRSGAELTLIHSRARSERWNPKANYYELADSPGDSEGCLRQALDDAGEDASTVRLVVSAEKAWLAITLHTLRENSDLVVVGKRSESRVDGPLLGSVSARLLRSCPCAIWVVKPDAAQQPRSLLAATDLTRVGERVLELAGSIAQECGSALHVVHALDLPLTVQMEGVEAREQYLEQARKEACDKIRFSLRDRDLRTPAELHVALSSPTRSITECVARLNPDLVVMGTISRGGIPGVVIGNTAERLLGRLDCPLLTVKPSDFVCSVSLDGAPADQGSRRTS